MWQINLHYDNIHQLPDNQPIHQVSNVNGLHLYQFIGVKMLALKKQTVLRTSILYRANYMFTSFF